MTGIAVGAGAGVVLAFAALAFGFWGFLLVLVLGAVGGLAGAITTGRFDVRAAVRSGRSGRVG